MSKLNNWPTSGNCLHRDKYKNYDPKIRQELHKSRCFEEAKKQEIA